ncbi:MSHA biogenesis protein MshI [Pseudomonas sp. Choline-3u-10]|jgi:Tfp pilus assembly protein PilN|uniref:PilN domain-containing protein n=2 Tax=Pseudomonadales TaxID=72274 RepID=UPI000617CF82|nr:MULTISPECIES: PilN domain-containing protein [Pseudomonadaceae]MAL37192.1 MSHA biogenesis protein MshI [Pseudomonas sp.]MBU0948711.1 PilN domain-containing protein [Gammaproteobacteria bacterium]KJJ64060.1 MSHA biogenesis protein MshI [Pseudomonas sp. 10B238]MBK3796841.1 MSHA biogenesis protein MshI [Stutzerimonas stutzeri]MBK3877344.1 MSHA biogenesis protein MshI [Stutzerimonas stutzeri]|tara:strand:- start:431 stop:1036 length:606 start_codon:yes stop_codon:yes gene_type:complete
MQNINLYQRERRSGGGPRPRQMQLGVVLVIAVLAIHGAWQGWKLHTAGQAAVLAEQQAGQAEARLDVVKADFREPTLDPRLPLQLAEREAENRELQRLADHLKTLDAQRSNGFSGLLQGLADRHPPQGLWLTRIRLQAGGDEMALQGLTQDQELLPLYLQSLGQSGAFSGREFARFDLHRDDRDLLQFRLSSQAVTEPDDE